MTFNHEDDGLNKTIMGLKLSWKINIIIHIQWFE